MTKKSARYLDVRISIILLWSYAVNCQGLEFGRTLPDVSASSSSRFLAKGLNGLAQEILHPWMLNAFLRGHLKQLDGRTGRKQLTEHGVQDHGRDAHADHDHAPVRGRFHVFFS